MPRRLQPPHDVNPLTDEAKAHVRRLFAELDASTAEMRAVQAERDTRKNGAFADLNARYSSAEARWDAAMVTLNLGLGASLNEAMCETHAAFRRILAAERTTTADRDSRANVARNAPRAVDAKVGAPSNGRTTPGYVGPSELADALGQTVGATRRLLDRGSIPGARRITPGLSNSPWLIPPNAAEEYLARFNTKGAT
jgi:hypothetical protein